jgi:hypothetical protein
MDAADDGAFRLHNLKDARKGAIRSAEERTELSPRPKELAKETGEVKGKGEKEREKGKGEKEMEKGKGEKEMEKGKGEKEMEKGMDEQKPQEEALKGSKKFNFSQLNSNDAEPHSPRKHADYREELTPRSVYTLVKDMKERFDNSDLMDSKKANVSAREEKGLADSKKPMQDKNGTERLVAREEKVGMADSKRSNVSRPKETKEKKETKETKEKKERKETKETKEAKRLSEGRKKGSKKERKATDLSSTMSTVSLVTSDTDGRISLKKTIGGGMSLAFSSFSSVFLIR